MKASRHDSMMERFARLSVALSVVLAAPLGAPDAVLGSLDNEASTLGVMGATKAVQGHRRARAGGRGADPSPATFDYSTLRTGDRFPRCVHAKNDEKWIDLHEKMPFEFPPVLAHLPPNHEDLRPSKANTFTCLSYEGNEQSINEVAATSVDYRSPGVAKVVENASPWQARLWHELHERKEFRQKVQNVMERWHAGGDVSPRPGKFLRVRNSRTPKTCRYGLAHLTSSLECEIRLAALLGRRLVMSEGESLRESGHTNCSFNMNRPWSDYYDLPPWVGTNGRPREEKPQTNTPDERIQWGYTTEGVRDLMASDANYLEADASYIGFCAHYYLCSALTPNPLPFSARINGVVDKILERMGGRDVEFAGVHVRGGDKQSPSSPQFHVGVFTLEEAKERQRRLGAAGAPDQWHLRGQQQQQRGRRQGHRKEEGQRQSGPRRRRLRPSGSPGMSLPHITASLAFSLIDAHLMGTEKGTDLLPQSEKPILFVATDTPSLAFEGCGSTFLHKYYNVLHWRDFEDIIRTEFGLDENLLKTCTPLVILVTEMAMLTRANTFIASDHTLISRHILNRRYKDPAKISEPIRYLYSQSHFHHFAPNDTDVGEWERVSKFLRMADIGAPDVEASKTIQDRAKETFVRFFAPETGEATCRDSYHDMLGF